MVTKKTSDKSSTKKEAEPKRILYELVEESTTKKHTIIGALSRAGLLTQYENEKKEAGRLNLPETITQTEFTKIIQNYLEE